MLGPAKSLTALYVSAPERHQPSGIAMQEDLVHAEAQLEVN